MIKRLFCKYEEIIAYLFWGGCTTLVNWGTYSIVVKWSGVITAANIISWLFATTFAYLTNKIWVFHSRSWEPQDIIKEFGKFVSARALTGVLEIVLVPLLVSLGLDQQIGGIKGSVSKVLVSIVVVLLNYIVSKSIVFRK